MRSTFVNFVPAPKPDFQPVFYFYLTSNGNPALVLDGGDISGAFNYPNLSAGTAYPKPLRLIPSGASTGLACPPDSTGRFAGTFNGQVCEFSPFAVDDYIVDPSHGFFVETDPVNPNSSSGVVSFGYYAARTPVCATCF
jgi:hypothetical protein